MEERSTRAIAGLRYFNKDNLSHWLQGTEPTQANVETFYRSVASSLSRNNIPIVQYQDLQPNASTLPPNANLTRNAITTITQAIYQKISESIPNECKTLQDIHLTYNRTEDGYAALYAIMRHSCGFLKLLRPTFGPSWPSTLSAYRYKSNLATWLDEQERHGQRYTPYEQAAEMLQRATSIERFKLTATSYLTRLKLHGPEMDLGNKYTLNELASVLESNSIDNPNMDHQTQPIINKFQRGTPSTNRNNNNNNGRKFTYRREVQCDCCHTFGHNIDEDICRIGAQVYHVINYIKDNEKPTKQNANSYTTANNKVKINAIETTFPDLFHDEDTQEEREDRIAALANIFQRGDTNNKTK
jgi:hypothetical protein